MNQIEVIALMHRTGITPKSLEEHVLKGVLPYSLSRSEYEALKKRWGMTLESVRRDIQSAATPV